MVLPNVTEVKDLGIIVDHELKFKRHIQDIATRAHQRASLILMRRLKLDLVMYYNILHGFVDIDAGSLFDTINCNVIRSCGHPLRIIKQYCNVNCSSSFVCRNVNTWNSLLEHVVNCKTTAMHF